MKGASVRVDTVIYTYVWIIVQCTVSVVAYGYIFTFPLVPRTLGATFSTGCMCDKNYYCVLLPNL